MKSVFKFSIGLLILIFPLAAIGGTIPGFEAGGHYYSQFGNPNPAPIAPGSTNYWCTVACLHMLFDYWDSVGNLPGIYPGGLLGGNMLPQEEIAWVVNVNDAQGIFGAAGNLYFGAGTYNGTQYRDDHRGAHFSPLSAAGPIVNGYSWEHVTTLDSYGYTSINADWTLAGGTLAQLKAYVDGGYPVILHICPTFRPNGFDPSYPYPPETIIGHSILLIGYHDVGDAVELEFHDPWFGPNVRYEQNNFFNNVWPWLGKRLMLFAAPWDRDVDITAPSTVIVGDNFNVIVDATYTDALPPISGSGVAIIAGTDQSLLAWSPVGGISLQGGQVNPASLGGTITISGTSGSSNFGMHADSAGNYFIDASGFAIILDVAISYPVYFDVIGGKEINVALTVQTTTTTTTAPTTTTTGSTTTSSTSTTSSSTTTSQTTTTTPTTTSTTTTTQIDDDTADDDSADDDSIDDDTGDDDSTDDDSGADDDSNEDDDSYEDDDDMAEDDDSGGDDDITNPDDDDNGRNGCCGC